MVTTPLPESSTLKCPSEVFSGKTYQGQETPVTQYLLCAQNGHDERMQPAKQPVENPSLNTKCVKFDVKKTDFQGDSRHDNEVTKGLKHGFQRSMSVPVGTTCTDITEDFPHEKVTENLKLSIYAPTSVNEDAASDPLLQKESKNGISCKNGGIINVHEGSEKVPSDKYVLNILGDDEVQCKNSKIRKKKFKKRHIICCIAVAAVFILALSAAGAVCYILSHGAGKESSHNSSTAKPPNTQCSVFETKLDTQLIQSDSIVPKQGYTLPFIVVNASSPGVYTDDGRLFMVRDPGWYEVHLTLHLNTFTWIQLEDMNKQFFARLCAICGTHEPHCVTDTLNAKERSYISITRKLEFRTSVDRLEFVLAVDNALMIKESKRDNVLQIHPLSCDSH